MSWLDGLYLQPSLLVASEGDVRQQGPRIWFIRGQLSFDSSALPIRCGARVQPGTSSSLSLQRPIQYAAPMGNGTSATQLFVPQGLLNPATAHSNGRNQLPLGSSSSSSSMMMLLYDVRAGNRKCCLLLPPLPFLLLLD